ncbi:MAG: sulfite exporter TauE/SafE family protein, partial [Rhizobiales bacterium]|nr:sulfite exporter TauE/SafE family protein [Hyphomicrobiales bacterium]
LGIASTPMLALYLPPLEAAALILPILITQDLISTYVYRKDWDAWNLKVMLPGAVIGMALAWLLAAHLSDALIRILVGGIGLVFVANTWLRRKKIKPHKATAASGAIWGAVSGFTSFMTQGGGPPFQAHVLPQCLPKMTLVGTTTIFFTVVNLLKIGPYFALAQFTPKNFVTSLLLLPIAVAANFCGIWLVKRTPTDLFYQIAYALLLVISLILFWQGVSALR